MNRTIYRTLGMARMVVLGGFLGTLAVSGCGKDKPDSTTGPGKFAISISEVILSPRAPSPGDTVSCSAVIVATDGDGNPVTNPGDFPTVSWSADGGQFLETGKLTVRWVAPSTSSLFLISCSATNAVNTAHNDRDVFVTAPVELIPAGAGGIQLFPNGTDFYYAHAADPSAAFDIWGYVGGVASDRVAHSTFWPTGIGLTVSPDLGHAAYAEITPPGFQKPNISVDLWLEDLAAGTDQQITTDGAAPGAPRRYVFTAPSFSPNGNLVAFQGLRPSLANGGVDSTDVFVYNITTAQTTIATDTHGVIRQRNNFIPTFSPDGNWVMFVSDRTSNNRWELYGLPVTGGVVATDSASTVQFTNTGGLVASGTPVTFSPPTIRWNDQPTNPVAAVLAAGDGSLLLVSVNGAGASVVTVSGFAAKASPREFAWSADGTQLAVYTSPTTELYVAGLSGQATRVLAVAQGDAVQDISWTPDGNWLLYRVLRGGTSWFELLDVGAGRLTRPVAVTPSSAAGLAASYSRSMRMSAPINSANQAYVPLFLTGQDTPRIVRVDLAGAVQ